MITSINKVIPRSSDLLEDIKGLQQMLDNKIKLYGDSLAQNGLEWKAMGLPVDDQLIEAIKDWLYNLCVSLLDVLDAECKKAEAVVHDMADLIKIPLGEKLMASILAGLEFISDTVTFIGSTSFKVTHQCRILVAIYGHWVSENLDHLNNTVEKKQQTTKRMDIRFMQLMDNIGQAIDYLNNIGDQELILNSNEPNDNALSTAETLNSVLVELNIRAIGTIEISRQHSHNKIAGNIMANPETAFIYMSESLLGLADRILELTGIDSVEKKRLQVLIY
ncbi:hypothetical protein BDB01DRAFT_841122 [Pilobolus umbonatus]|nr:hypothetical protein BDB01DRAFT_841122 [Pilobolus umbonatus]